MYTANSVGDLPGTRDALPEAVDVVVVGGGIAGASTLYHLAEAGIDALLLERGTVGGGATAAAIGILSPPVRQPFHEMAHHRGDETAARIWRFALDSVASLGAALREAGAAEEAELDLSGGTVLAESHSEHEVRASFEASEQTYGSPRVFEDLIEDGWAVSEKTVAASMARQGLQGRCTTRKRRSLTRPDAAAPPLPDLVQRDFGASRIDEKWCGDLTEMLDAALDEFGGVVVGGDGEAMGRVGVGSA